MTIELSPLAKDILVRRVAQGDAPWLPIRGAERTSYVIPGAIWYARPAIVHQERSEMVRTQRY